MKNSIYTPRWNRGPQKAAPVTAKPVLVHKDLDEKWFSENIEPGGFHDEHGNFVITHYSVIGRNR
jgi:hypothetical protein